MHSFGKTVEVIHRQVIRDAYGDETVTVTGIDTHYGCAVAPRFPDSVESSQLAEPTERYRSSVIVGYTVFLPADATVGAYDRLRWDGEEYEIDGLPGDWSHPMTGWTPGVQVSARRVTDG